MAGLLTHMIIVVVAALVLFFLTRTWKYGLAFVVGHLIPDVINFGVIGLKNWNLSFDNSIRDPLFKEFVRFTHNFYFWLVLLFVLFVIVMLIYWSGKVSRESVKKIIICEVLFYVGAAAHIIVDKFIIETSYWI